MRHIFIINPHAGRTNKSKEIIEEIENLHDNIQYEIYVTTCHLDGFRYVKEYCENHKEEDLRFYSCGGDGTLHEVINGSIEHKHTEIACLAFGSGNDFVKNFGEISQFRNISDAIHGESRVVDLLLVDKKDYCVNILNLGFDGEVTFKMLKYKGLPLVSGPMSYNLAVVDSLMFKMTHYIKLTLDDEVVFDGKALLVACANGLCYGGGFYCAPKAKVDDGLIDVCLIKKVSRLKASTLIKEYKAGRHLDNEKINPILIYKNAKKILLECHKPVAYAVDGEVFRKDKLLIEMVDNKLRFIIPQKR